MPDRVLSCQDSYKGEGEGYRSERFRCVVMYCIFGWPISFSNLAQSILILCVCGCVCVYADGESDLSDTMDARIDSIDSATDTSGSDEPWREGTGEREGERGRKKVREKEREGDKIGVRGGGERGKGRYRRGEEKGRKKGVMWSTQGFQFHTECICEYDRQFSDSGYRIASASLYQVLCYINGPL